MKLILVLLLAVHAQAVEVREEPVEHAGAKFRIIRLDPRDVSLVWKKENGEPYRTFDAVQAEFSKQGKTVKFLMNAGIFEPGGIPSGIHIENSQTLRPPNFRDGEGNFFLKPTGIVSFGETTGPLIGPLDRWRTQPPKQPVWAVQSGPILLIEGKRHPRFKNGSENRLHRNGVGIDPEKRFVFAITAPGEMVNLWDFAGLFLKLGCRNALFLDGDISQCAVNPASPVESNRFGAMFVVAE